MRLALIISLTLVTSLALADAIYDEQKIRQAEVDYQLAGLQLAAIESTCAQLRASGKQAESDNECFTRLKLAADSCVDQYRRALLESSAAGNPFATDIKVTLRAEVIESCIIEAGTPEQSSRVGSEAGL